MKKDSVDFRSEIARAATEAVGVIAKAAAEATQAVGTAAANAVQAQQINRAADHDLLVVLNSKVEDLKTTVNQSSTGVSSRLLDHENRIRSNETAITKTSTWGTALILFVGIAEFLINRFFH